MNDPELPEPPEPPPLRYAVRVTQRARREIDAAAVRLVELAGDSVAFAWLNDLTVKVGNLAAGPRQHALLSEQALFVGEVRQFLHRRPRSSSAHRLLFSVQDEGDDGPVVWVLHLRPAAARPIRRKEAREIESNR